MARRTKKADGTTRREQHPIWEKEQPPEPKESGKARPKSKKISKRLAKMMEEDAGLGHAGARPIDIGWGGGGTPTSERDEIAEMVRVQALTKILLSIIDQRAVDDPRRGDRTHHKPLRQYRLEQVLSLLLGISASSGPRSIKFEKVAKRAAPAYYAQAFGLAPERSERDIFIEARWPNGRSEDLVGGEIDTAIADYIDYFERHKHRLMIEYALAEIREFEFGHETADAIIRELRDIGLAGPTGRG